MWRAKKNIQVALWPVPGSSTNTINKWKDHKDRQESFRDSYHSLISSTVQRFMQVFQPAWCATTIAWMRSPKAACLGYSNRGLLVSNCIGLLSAPQLYDPTHRFHDLRNMSEHASHTPSCRSGRFRRHSRAYGDTEGLWSLSLKKTTNAEPIVHQSPTGGVFRRTCDIRCWFTQQHASRMFSRG